jgi:hydrogenase-4 component F
MNPIQLLALLFFTFLGIFFLLLFTFTRSDEKIIRWSPLVLLFFIITVISVWTQYIFLQWLLVSSLTFVGAILISLSKTAKSVQTAWKYLFVKSVGSSIVFLGLICILMGLDTGADIMIDLRTMISQLPPRENLLVEHGIFFSILGYLTLLGIFPGHFWVEDSYAEGPSQISSTLSAFNPVVTSIALYPFLHLDDFYQSPLLQMKDVILILGTITLIYSIWKFKFTTDIRKITSLIALFHTAGIAVLMGFLPEEKVFYYVLGASVSINAFLFACMGILRIDLGARDLNLVDRKRGITVITTVLFLLALGMSFLFPLSPIFLSEIILIRIGLEQGKYWVVFYPLLSGLFFFLSLKKFLPLLSLSKRRFIESERKVLDLRVRLTFLLLFISLWIGVLGLYEFLWGGF